MAFPLIANWQVYDDAGRRKYVNATERQRFLSAADSFDLPLRTLCYTLVFCGCRISEALSLTRHQLDSERLTLTFRTLKSRRLSFRVVPIPRELAVLLLALPPQWAAAGSVDTTLS